MFGGSAGYSISISGETRGVVQDLACTSPSGLITLLSAMTGRLDRTPLALLGDISGDFGDFGDRDGDPGELFSDTLALPPLLGSMV
jgi:hypothetical protein